MNIKSTQILADITDYKQRTTFEERVAALKAILEKRGCTDIEGSMKAFVELMDNNTGWAKYFQDLVSKMQADITPD